MDEKLILQFKGEMSFEEINKVNDEISNADIIILDDRWRVIEWKN